MEVIPKTKGTETVMGRVQRAFPNMSKLGGKDWWCWGETSQACGKTVCRFMSYWSYIYSYFLTERFLTASLLLCARRLVSSRIWPPLKPLPWAPTPGFPGQSYISKPFCVFSYVSNFEHSISCNSFPSTWKTHLSPRRLYHWNHSPTVAMWTWFVPPLSSLCKYMPLKLCCICLITIAELFPLETVYSSCRHIAWYSTGTCLVIAS